MAEVEDSSLKGQPSPAEQADEARELIRELVKGEPQRHPLIFGLVSAIGTPLEPVVRALEEALTKFGYVGREIRLSKLLDEISYQPWGRLPAQDNPDYYEKRMNAGDQLRQEVGDGSALAAIAVARIQEIRQELGNETALILRSLKHPSEVDLLRHVYGDAFYLVAVASSIDERRETLAEMLSLFENPRGEAEKLIDRDEFDPSENEFGQQVRDAYGVADVYIPSGRGLSTIPEVERFIDSVFGSPFLTPRATEEGMRLAFDASFRSAAAGRQVGAALIPKIGTPIVVGTNEVPKPGGGQYWVGDVPDFRDFQTGADPNPLYTRRVVQELLERLAKNRWLIEELRELRGAQLLERATRKDETGKSLIDGARASALIEFTRCLHAEQAAIINSARAGVSTDGAVLFSTTFPCHECAKMILGAGMITVIYVEPYPKSLVSRLYHDLINTAPSVTLEEGLDGGRVPFRSFVGIAPRRYETSFMAGKRREGHLIAAFDRQEACPRTEGWSEMAISERENTVIASMNLVLRYLAEMKDQPASIERGNDKGTGEETPPRMISG